MPNKFIISAPMISYLRGSVLVLSNSDPVGQGTRQLVFEHPTESDTLIKVLKPDIYDDMGNLLKKRWFDKFRKASAFDPFKREFSEFVDLKAQHQNEDVDLPLCYIQGIVQCDLGIGFIYEKIADPDGALSETLYNIVRNKTATQQHILDLEPFFKALDEHHVVLGDLNMKNIVYQKRKDGTARYVGIDGTGSKQAVPLRKWFKSQNSKKIRQVHERCVRKIGAAIQASGHAARSKLAATNDTP